jgi:hypothetical protein
VAQIDKIFSIRLSLDPGQKQTTPRRNGSISALGWRAVVWAAPSRNLMSASISDDAGDSQIQFRTNNVIAFCRLCA